MEENALIDEGAMRGTPPVPPFLRTVKLLTLLTVRQLLAKKKLIFILVLLFLPTFIAVILRAHGIDLGRGYYILVPTAYIVFLAPLLCLFQGASIFGEDVDNRTMCYLLMRPISRDAIWCGKVLGVASVSFVLLTFSAIATYLPSVWKGSIGSLFDAQHLSDLAGLIGVIGIACLVYTALFVLISLCVQHVMIFGILYYLIVEAAFSMLPGPPAAISLSHHLGRLLPRNFATIEILQYENIFRQDVTQSFNRFAECAGILLAFTVLSALGIFKTRSNDFYTADDD